MAMGGRHDICNHEPSDVACQQKENCRKERSHPAAGIILPEGMDDESFVTLFGMGSTLSKAGKEMEAIRAANFLMANDPSGGAWIKFNKVPGDDVGGRGGRKRRRG